MRAFLITTALGLAALAWMAGMLAQPVNAQDSRMSLSGPTDTCFAVVEIMNRYGLYNRDETLMTEHGPVVLRYHTVGGHNLTDADEVTVLSVPDGVTADPVQMALPDGQTGRVCLAVWLGF